MAVDVRPGAGNHGRLGRGRCRLARPQRPTKLSSLGLGIRAKLYTRRHDLDRRGRLLVRLRHMVENAVKDVFRAAAAVDPCHGPAPGPALAADNGDGRPIAREVRERLIPACRRPPATAVADRPLSIRRLGHQRRQPSSRAKHQPQAIPRCRRPARRRPMGPTGHVLDRLRHRLGRRGVDARAGRQVRPGKAGPEETVGWGSPGQARPGPCGTAFVAVRVSKKTSPNGFKAGYRHGNSPSHRFCHEAQEPHLSEVRREDQFAASPLQAMPEVQRRPKKKNSAAAGRGKQFCVILSASEKSW